MHDLLNLLIFYLANINKKKTLCMYVMPYIPIVKYTL